MPQKPGLPRPLPARVGIVTGAVLLSTLAIPALAGESIGKALKKGKVTVDLRYRYETVEDDAFTEDALASTLRLRLGYGTGKYYGFSVYTSFDTVQVIGPEEYNSTANGLVQFPLVPDPEDTQINQAYVGYSGLKDTEFKLGRQLIALDNQRFIGNIGWRQIEQTFDAFFVTTELPGKVAFLYSYLTKANRVFGEHNPNPRLASTDLDSHLFHASHEFSVGTLAGYAYLLDFQSTPAASHRDLGLRFTGRRAVSDKLDLLYAAELADQSGYADGASIIDARYSLAELGVGAGPVTATLEYEVLGGDGIYAFQTPLATLHKFNGWTDKFLVTPPAGLRDLYLSLAGEVAKVKLLAVFHDFSADEGGADYGSEIGLGAGRTFKEMYFVGLKYARYDADSFSTDTDKLWITLQLKF